jgi:hypothetical protein
MKTQNFIKGLVACGVVLAMTSTLSAQTVKEGSAKVVRIKGDARWFPDGNNSQMHPLKVGDVLRAGSTIQTSRDKGAYVDLILGEGGGGAVTAAPSTASDPFAAPMAYKPTAEQNIVRVKEDSVLGIDKLTSTDTGADVVTDTQLDLRRGRIFGNVKKMSAASKYEVKIPNGVAGIRGTTYEISSEGVIRVSVGSVVIAYVGADGTVVTQVVMGGQQFDARSGQVTPMPPSFLKDLDATGRESRVYGEDREGTYEHNHTIYHLSPTHGRRHHHNGDGGDGGQG